FWCDGILTDLYSPHFEGKTTEIQSSCVGLSSYFPSTPHCEPSIEIVKRWNTEKVACWLESCGFDSTVKNKFKEKHIAGNDLLNLTLSTLKDNVKIIPYGIRIRIIHNLHCLRQSMSVIRSQDFANTSPAEECVFDSVRTPERESLGGPSVWKNVSDGHYSLPASLTAAFSPEEALDAFYIPFEQIQLSHCIRMHPLGGLYFANWLGKEVAVKVFQGKRVHPSSWKRFIHLLKNLRHPNIVLVLGVSEKPPWMHCIVMEWMQKESLFAWLHPMQHALSLRCTLHSVSSSSSLFSTPASPPKPSLTSPSPSPFETHGSPAVRTSPAGTPPPHRDAPGLALHSKIQNNCRQLSHLVQQQLHDKASAGQEDRLWEEGNTEYDRNVKKMKEASKIAIFMPEKIRREGLYGGLLFNSSRRRCLDSARGNFATHPGRRGAPFSLSPLSLDKWKLFLPSWTMHRTDFSTLSFFKKRKQTALPKHRFLSYKELIKIARDVALGCIYLKQKGVWLNTVNSEIHL
ncbi:hypothetical protein IE077_002309, partial [Cardiosporidium cionae]